MNVVVTALLMFISRTTSVCSACCSFFAALLAIFFALAVADPIVASVRALTERPTG